MITVKEAYFTNFLAKFVNAYKLRYYIYTKWMVYEKAISCLTFKISLSKFQKILSCFNISTQNVRPYCDVYVYKKL